MLKTLRRIVQEISTTPHFDEALQILVRRVREAVATQACTVFLLNKAQTEYMLLATDGLNPEAVGKIRLKIGEGLVGLVGQRGEPINLEDAPAHPNFFHAPTVGEERFKSFLGVPIIHNRRLFGVLVIQQEERRRFDEAEEAFLVTISAQLGGVIAHAEATGVISRLMQRNKNKKSLTLGQQDIIFSGIAGAPGVGIGTAVVVYPLADLDAVPDRQASKLGAERTALKKALTTTRAEIRSLSKRLTALPKEEKALFTAYLRLLDSASLEKEILEEIKQGHWAQGALRRVIKKHVQQFEAMDDDYLRERAADLRDLGRRVLLHLQAGQRSIPDYPAQTILIGEEVSPAALAEVPEGRLAGVVASEGSKNSHVAIMARSLGIPTVMGIENLPVNQLEGQTIIVDGYQGQVYVDPSPKIRRTFNHLLQQQRELTASLEEMRHLPAQTLDGHTIALWVNTGLAADATLSLTAGAEGVGLYRTEIPFMNRDRFPTEEEQYVIYRQLLSAFAPRPVIMRTLDIGGDKMLPYFPVSEDNPFLGWRGIRITLDHPEIFLVQIRAMLRASHELNNLRIMLPMISSAHETDEALRLIQQAYQELCVEGVVIPMPLVGVMIEVPSAIYLCGALANRVDFLSVGSNDLTQYILAVDRNNARVANLYDGLHPAMLHALHHAATAAHTVGKPISICGEMASDPMAILLLMAMGYDGLSMNSTALLKTKQVIRKFTLQQTKQLLAETLAMDTAQDIRKHLEKALCDAGLGSLLGIQ
jgi:phosphotransferase system enzyme I (PtsP)